MNPRPIKELLIMKTKRETLSEAISLGEQAFKRGQGDFPNRCKGYRMMVSESPVYGTEEEAGTLEITEAWHLGWRSARAECAA